MDRQSSTSPSQIPTAHIALERMTSYRRIEEAFHCKLIGPVVVDKKTLMELQNFQTVRFGGTIEKFVKNVGICEVFGHPLDHLLYPLVLLTIKPSINLHNHFSFFLFSFF